MNCETCQLKELVLEPTEIRDVLRCESLPIFASSLKRTNAILVTSHRNPNVLDSFTCLFVVLVSVIYGIEQFQSKLGNNDEN